MKKTPFAILTAVALLAIPIALQARVITLTIGGTNMESTLTIGSNEIAEIKSVHDDRPNAAPCRPKCILTKDDITYQFSNSSGTGFGSVLGKVIRGPATLSLRACVENSEQIAFVTVDISPEIFPPDKTLIVPERTGARVAFECSTNLIDWTEVWAGTYTNVPSNKFFRIKAERTP